MFQINAVVSCLLILNESRQICYEGIEYFYEPFNWLDIAGNIFMIISAVNLSESPGNAFYEDTLCKRYLILGILLVGLRAVSNLRIFESYRVQIQIFKTIFVDIFWFMSLLMILIILSAIIFGIEFAIEKKKDKKEGKPENIGVKFMDNIGLFYQFMLGENPYEDHDMNPTAWLVYVTFTILVQVIALNLLVAILSETFANVMGAMTASHCRTKVDILLEISGLKCLFKKNTEETKFIHFVMYASDKMATYVKS